MTPALLLTIGYVVKGFWAGIAKHGIQPQASEGSELDVMEYVIGKADLVEQAWEQLQATKPDAWSGVWEYEISEPFGEWLAQQIDPSDAKCRTHINLLIKQGCV